MVSNLDSDPCHSRAQDAVLPAWILWRESPRIDDLDNADVCGDDEGWEDADVHPVRDLDLESDAMQTCPAKRAGLCLIAMQWQFNVNGLMLILFTFINVRTLLWDRVLMSGVETLPYSTTQANSSLNSSMLYCR